MSSITIDIPEGRLTELRKMAGNLNISLEELARLGVEELLAQPDEKFEQVAKYVLEKNAALYERLA